MRFGFERLPAMLVLAAVLCLVPPARGQNDGTVTAQPANSAGGSTASVPVVLSLNSRAPAINSLAFGAAVLPGAGSPPILTNLTFQSATGLPAAPFASATTSNISLFWSSISPSLSGTVTLGVLQIAIPPSAVVGQTYTIQVTGASASSNSISIPLGPGPDAVLTIRQTYVIGDVMPSTGTSAGQFGDGSVDTLDLLAILRAITGVSVPPKCSDLYDAMDVFPVDTATTRGGGDGLDTLDLLAELRRVTNVDKTRPVRVPNANCTTAGPQAKRVEPMAPAAAMSPRVNRPVARWPE